uniref:Putative secreted protein n=1 Tax=Ixodes scapularis TaxID=6945 RepID=A0A4D5RVX2_IXOSC
MCMAGVHCFGALVMLSVLLSLGHCRTWVPTSTRRVPRPTTLTARAWRLAPDRSRPGPTWRSTWMNSRTVSWRSW